MGNLMTQIDVIAILVQTEIIVIIYIVKDIVMICK